MRNLKHFNNFGNNLQDSFHQEVWFHNGPLLMVDHELGPQGKTSDGSYPNGGRPLGDSFARFRFPVGFAMGGQPSSEYEGPQDDGTKSSRMPNLDAEREPFVPA